MSDVPLNPGDAVRSPPRPRTRRDAQFDRIRDREAARQGTKLRGGRFLSKFLNNRLAVVGLVIFASIILLSLAAPLIAQHDPKSPNLRAMLDPPSAEHWFGTDRTGRDIFARVLYGGRVSILVGLGSALLSALIGVVIGVYSGYVGGWLDWVAMRISEIFMSFPQIILVLLLVAILGQSLLNLIVIFTLTGWGGIYRMARARMLSIREEEYVQALRSFGLGPARIAYKHMLPNALGPIMVNITLSTAAFILQEAGLSFLGLGVPMSVPTWGNILNAAQDLRLLENAWWVWLPVGATISLFVLSVNFIGDGLRDATDPSQQG
ncbi:ABC transporter membrane-spanning permease - oligopeptide transport [Oceanicola granulosus HTCC2516]|uniref:ABC transporter membrane-spanning permease-oligopeptide transport n=1 Tax=Oceanicola granulosus (strain ATCC BAA-861 / DSM 15982 / KCTC 12143 / HTCC2516) TaxID=314256 RepID=Q2CJ71_OCEGH|nr:ABC transporter permease [Oceanicola granulosus]EAR52729.1 ABC transporter membrane-spanning permease - oligopeptide transport [Oceanicola granulosus HTCC2516]